MSHHFLSKSNQSFSNLLDGKTDHFLQFWLPRKPIKSQLLQLQLRQIEVKQCQLQHLSDKKISLIAIHSTKRMFHIFPNCDMDFKTTQHIFKVFETLFCQLTLNFKAKYINSDFWKKKEVWLHVCTESSVSISAAITQKCGIQHWFWTRLWIVGDRILFQIDRWLFFSVAC